MMFARLARIKVNESLFKSLSECVMSKISLPRCFASTFATLTPFHVSLSFTIDCCMTINYAGSKTSGKARCKQCCCTFHIVRSNISRNAVTECGIHFPSYCNRISRENLERQVQATFGNLAQVARYGRTASNDVQSCDNANPIQNGRGCHFRMVPHYKSE